MTNAGSNPSGGGETFRDIVAVSEASLCTEMGMVAYCPEGLVRASIVDGRLVLVLRDILDRPDATIRSWETGRYTDAIDRFYDRILVLGTPVKPGP